VVTGKGGIFKEGPGRDRARARQGC
jgi:hypothetical protein